MLLFDASWINTTTTIDVFVNIIYLSNLWLHWHRAKRIYRSSKWAQHKRYSCEFWEPTYNCHWNHKTAPIWMLSFTGGSYKAFCIAWALDDIRKVLASVQTSGVSIWLCLWDILSWKTMFSLYAQAKVDVKSFRLDSCTLQQWQVCKSTELLYMEKYLDELKAMSHEAICLCNQWRRQTWRSEGDKNTKWWRHRADIATTQQYGLETRQNSFQQKCSNLTMGVDLTANTHPPLPLPPSVSRRI